MMKIAGVRHNFLIILLFAGNKELSILVLCLVKRHDLLRSVFFLIDNDTFKKKNSLGMEKKVGLMSSKMSVQTKERETGNRSSYDNLITPQRLRVFFK